jgi:DNA-binding protein H-NS
MRFAKPLRQGYTDRTIFQEIPMARPKSLAKLSLEALVDLRDSVTAAISEQAENLQKQLSRLTGGGNSTAKRRGRPPGKAKKSKLKGRKVAAKYRSKKDAKLTWAGRGATPRWMRDEMKTGKLKKDAFLIK